MALVTILASLAAPSGIMPCLDKRAAQIGMSRSQMLARAALVQGDWDAIATALGGVNAANLRRLCNAAKLTLVVIDAPTNIDGPSGAVNSNSYGGAIVSVFGELS